MKLKKCTICKELRPGAEFYKNRTSYDGLEGYCKTCTAWRGREYYRKHPDRVKATVARYVARNREKARAWWTVHRKVPTVRVCEIYGCSRLGVRHHNDYSKPLEITWLCRSHHIQFHSMTKNLINKLKCDIMD